MTLLLESPDIYQLPLKESEVYDSVAVTSGSNEFTPTFRNKAHSQSVVNCVHETLNTHHHLFSNAAALFKDRPCLGFRSYDYRTCTLNPEFVSNTYGEVNRRRHLIGSGILASLKANKFKDLNLKSHQKIETHTEKYHDYGKNTPSGILREENCSFIVSIFSANRPEWILTDLACSSYSITNTALYDTLGAGVSQYILELTSSPIVVCSRDKIALLAEMKQKSTGTLANLISIVSMDLLNKDDDQNLFQACTNARIELMDLAQLEEIGIQNQIKELPPTPNTMYTISFTSGTTGSKPKGVMLTQGNAAAAITFLSSLEPKFDSPQGRAFIFLPLTHIYERQTSAFALSNGYYLGFPQLTVGFQKVPNTFDLLIDDLKIFKPHYFSIVPRILTKLEGFIKQYLETTEDKLVINRIIDYKLEKQIESDGSKGDHLVYDKYAPYTKLRSLVGFDNLLWTQTASAPVAPSTLQYLKASLNIGIRQLYGLTEVFGAITTTQPFDSDPGNCGSIGVCGEMKLRSVSDMGYSINSETRSPIGEVMLRGPQTFIGYYYNKEETDNALEKDGWFHTGDIGMIACKGKATHGRLYIVDRVKNFFKLSQGEYISPEKIENRYLSCNPILQQLYVHGDSLQSFVVGVCGVSYEDGVQFLESCGYTNSKELDHEQMLTEMNSVAMKTKFLKNLNDNVKDLNGFEKLQNVHIAINPLTVERNVVTPTFKIKRGVAAKYFASIFDLLYQKEKSLTQGLRSKL